MNRGEIASPAGQRGPLVLQACALQRAYRLGRGRRAPVLMAARDVAFGLYRGSVVALVGESGSGKSTVARILSGQERPTSGEVRLDGVAVHLDRRRAFRAYKREVQMVFQDPFASLNSTHTVRYHLERPVRIHKTVERSAIGDELERLMHEVRLEPAEQFLAKYPHELSGGQRQRVAIARAIAARPRVLLADEPISMLDVSIRVAILRLLDELRGRLELAILYITHDIASARYFADETLVMYAGEIVERGPSEEVTQRPAHPYTQLLVASAPDPDRPVDARTRRRARGAGQAGSALSSVVGCRFAPRCPLAIERCWAEAPSLELLDESHAASCWRLEVAAAGGLAR
jgi:peptide/nickel transport system ATP-binding protein